MHRNEPTIWIRRDYDGVVTLLTVCNEAPMYSDSDRLRGVCLEPTGDQLSSGMKMEEMSSNRLRHFILRCCGIEMNGFCSGDKNWTNCCCLLDHSSWSRCPHFTVIHFDSYTLKLCNHFFISDIFCFFLLLNFCLLSSFLNILFFYLLISIHYALFSNHILYFFKFSNFCLRLFAISKIEWN